jgi:hypothetical protein
MSSPPPYIITDYTKRQARKLGVKIKHSTLKNKKIDVFDKDGKKIASVGGLGYSDYPTYIKSHGRKYANTRRKLYRIRHERDRHVEGTAGFFADKLLW